MSMISIPVKNGKLKELVLDSKHIDGFGVSENETDEVLNIDSQEKLIVKFPVYINVANQPSPFVVEHDSEDERAKYVAYLKRKLGV